jgi:cytochrome c551/c552
MEGVKPFACSIALAAALLAAPVAALADEGAEALADRYHCFTCHRVEVRHVGPAFSEVARRYKEDPRALEKLSAKVRRGGTGNWGTLSMPPNDVREADLHTLLRWVLARS